MTTTRDRQTVIPAIIPQSVTHLETALHRVSFAHEIHVDVVDGRFVTPVSWPYNPVGNPLEQATVMAPYSVEVDLMVAQPLVAAEAWAASGAQMLVFHVETVTVNALTQFTAAHENITVGVSALNDTAWETLVPYLSIADYVQVMGIATIGAQGASFDARALERIETIVEKFPEMEISVDGSVNQETVKSLLQAGADRFIVGSAIMQAPDPHTAYHALQTLARPQR